MIKVLCFSKNRRMQLSCFLDSLLYHTDVLPSQIQVMTPSPDSYREMKLNCDEVLKEPTLENLHQDKIRIIDRNKFGGFDRAFRRWVDFLDDDDIAILAVDDYVYFRGFRQSDLEEFFDSEYSKFSAGISLRLGTNISQIYKIENESGNNKFFRWSWAGKPSHFSYNFDISNSAYKGSFLKGLVHELPEMRIPNDLESHAVHWMWNFADTYPCMTMFNGFGTGACIDCNRVQDLYQNKTQGDKKLTAEYLDQLYDQGKMIDFKNYSNLIPNDVFIGDTNLMFIDR